MGGGVTQLPFHYVGSVRMAEQHHSRFRDSTALLSTAHTNDDGCCCERSSSQLGSNQLWTKDEAHSPMLPADKSKDRTHTPSYVAPEWCLGTPPLSHRYFSFARAVELQSRNSHISIPITIGYNLNRILFGNSFWNDQNSKLLRIYQEMAKMLFRNSPFGTKIIIIIFFFLISTYFWNHLELVKS